MSRRKRFVLMSLLGLLMVLGPVVSAINCTGFNEGSGKVSSCFVNYPLAAEFSQLSYMVALISSFTVGIPVFTYGTALVFLMRILNRRGKALEHLPKERLDVALIFWPNTRVMEVVFPVLLISSVWFEIQAKDMSPWVTMYTYFATCLFRFYLISFGYLKRKALS